MSKTTSITLLALAGAVLLSTSVEAALSYSPRDLILGIRNSTGATQDLEVNIGQASQYFGASSSFVVPNVNLTDIVSALGSFNSAIWSVSGTIRPTDTVGDGIPLNTLWLTRASGSTALPRNNNTAQQSTGAKVNSLGTVFASTATQATGANAGIIGNTVGNSYTKAVGPAGNFTGSASGNIETTTAANFSSIGGKSISDLYELRPGTGPGTLLGSFEFTNDGTLMFVPVPEASTYGLMAGAGLLLLSVRQQFRRKNA